MGRLLVVSLGILFGVPAGGLAQAPSFGLEVGLNRADFSGCRIVDSKHRAGFTVGGFAAIPLSTALTIQPEVLFSRRGARSTAYDYSSFPMDGDAPPLGAYLTETTRHDYLEVPVLLKISLSAHGQLVRPVLFAGPSLGFLLGVKRVYGIDYGKYLNSTDLGIIIGGGVELGRLSLDVRYNLGLTTIEKDYDATFGHVPGAVKNRAFTVATGFRLF